MNNKLLEKISKNSTVTESCILSESKFFTEKDMIQTDIHMLNVAFSGKLLGGFVPGLTMFAAPSKHFKTTFSLIMAASYLKKYKDAVLMFIDTEFGTPISYFKSFNIDLDRVLHIPVTDVEQLKHELTVQLQQIEKGDKIIIVIDSIGNLASKKEVDDAADGKSVADMSRAKQIKSLFRIVTPHLTLKDIPMIVVNHTYKSMELFCLHGETKIKTSNGLKFIKDIDVGEYVYALTGLKKVIRKYTPDDLPTKNVKYLKLTFDDGSTVKCTDTHKFLMKDSVWVEASNIKIGDEFR